MPDAHDSLLALHVATGALGLILGPVVLQAERRSPHRSAAGLAYLWAVAVVALTALALVAYDPAGLWWLAPLALLTDGLALLGVIAPRRHGEHWVGLYARGQGGSYIALVTAALVVSLEGPAAVVAWIAPTTIGLMLIERRVRRLRSRETESRGHDHKR